MLQLSRPQPGGTVLDLHGLHVREVQAVLPRQLQALAAQQQRVVSGPAAEQVPAPAATAICVCSAAPPRRWPSPAFTPLPLPQVSLIVGVGSHSTHTRDARVLPAVELLLLELGYEYSQPQAGLLTLHL
jgi:hypothetical protein